MSIRWILIATLAVGSFAFSPRASQAQNGQLIEGLFRTLAESQLERERRKRLETEEQARLEAQRRANNPARDPYQVKLPSGFGVPPRNQPATVPSPRPGTPPATQQISVRSKQAADYANGLIQFNQAYAPMVADLHRASAGNARIRALMPDVYALSAAGRSLLIQCDELDSLGPIKPAHRDFDQSWRQLSFELNRIGGLSSECNTTIKRCDELCATMGGYLGLSAQFNRVGLRDKMIIGAAYMQTLIDDLNLSRLPQNQCHSLVHDCRLLRQRLVNASSHVDEFSYDEVVQQFNEFTEDWRRFSAKVSTFNDPYLNRRLDRIGALGNTVYGLLRLPPPVSLRDVPPVVERIAKDVETITQRINLRILGNYPAGEQVRVLQLIRDLNSHSENLQRRAAGDNPALEPLQKAFVDFDTTWQTAKPFFDRLPTLNRTIVAELSRSCQQLRQILQVNTDYSAPLSIGELVQSAAALEGTAEYLQRKILRYKDELRPNSFRDQVVGDAKSLLRHAREVHEVLSRTERLRDPKHLARLQEESRHLLEDWNEFSIRLGQLKSHGMHPEHVNEMRRYQQDILPAVAQLSAALVDR